MLVPLFIDSVELFGGQRLELATGKADASQGDPEQFKYAYSFFFSSSDEPSPPGAEPTENWSFCHAAKSSAFM